MSDRLSRRVGVVTEGLRRFFASDRISGHTSDASDPLLAGGAAISAWLTGVTGRGGSLDGGPRGEDTSDISDSLVSSI